MHGPLKYIVFKWSMHDAIKIKTSSFMLILILFLGYSHENINS